MCVGTKLAMPQTLFLHVSFAPVCWNAFFPFECVCGTVSVSRCNCSFEPVLMAGDREATFLCFVLCFCWCVVVFKANC